MITTNSILTNDPGKLTTATASIQLEVSDGSCVLKVRPRRNEVSTESGSDRVAFPPA